MEHIDTEIIVPDLVTEAQEPVIAPKRARGRPRKNKEVPEVVAEAPVSKEEKKAIAYRAWYAEHGRAYFAEYNKANYKRVKEIRDKASKVWHAKKRDQLEEDRKTLVAIIDSIKENAKKLGFDIIVNNFKK